MNFETLENWITGYIGSDSHLADVEYLKDTRLRHAAARLFDLHACDVRIVAVAPDAAIVIRARANWRGEDSLHVWGALRLSYNKADRAVYVAAMSKEQAALLALYVYRNVLGRHEIPEFASYANALQSVPWLTTKTVLDNLSKAEKIILSHPCKTGEYK